ncbi:MAG: hypothetical protein FJX44_09220 [Alphaproteobacteria bacterium]|nr:hypothetical protein [Alphaproteobacteria bacterium]
MVPIRGQAMRRKTALGLILAASFGLPALAAEPNGPTELITRTEAVRIAIQDKLAAQPAKNETIHTALVDYYAVPGRKPLWIGDAGVSERGSAVIGEIRKAGDYGLRAADYKLPDADSFDAAGNASEWLATAEIKISTAVVDYANDARGGRIDPQRLSKNLDPTLALPNPGEVLESIAIRSDPAAYLRSFQPDHPQFEALRQKLIELRGGSKPVEPEKPEVVTIPEGPVLKLGLKHPQVALLRTRLEVPAQDGGDETMFDEDVREAVRRFQSDHGTTPDGLVGAGTRRMLNNPSGAKQAGGGKASIDAIIANMERWRWLPRDLGEFHVMANIPEFTLRVVEDDEVVHTARVVIGKPNTQTAVFSDEMEEVVFNPYWNVPTSIKANEIAPYLRTGGGFFGGGWDTSVLRRHGLRIRGYNGREIDPDSVDWSRVDVRTLELYQPPGPGNVLGAMKFVFPNKHDIYMHDTTQKHLFTNAVRSESHGCVRVQNPEQFAFLLLNHDQGWTKGHVASAINGRDDNHIVLQNKIPVHIVYFTVRVNEDGSLSTFRDLYRHDARIIGALNGAPMVSEEFAPEMAETETRPRVRYRQRNDFGRDFTRTIFGF